MKKTSISVKLFATVVGILLFIQIPTFAATGKSTAKNVRVRATASTESEVIELLAVDDVVQILAKEGDWYKVTFNGKTGYVSQSFISTTDKIEETGSNVANNNQDKEQENQNQENKETAGTDGEQENKASENKTEENANTNVASEDNSQSNGNNENNPGTAENVNNAENTAPSAANATASEANTALINNVYKLNQNVSLNILPVVTSEGIGTANKDEEVIVLSKAGLWIYVKKSDVCGWIRADKLVIEGSSSEAQNSDEKKDEASATNNAEQSQKAEEQANAQAGSSTNTEAGASAEADASANTNTETNANANSGATEEKTAYTPKTMYAGAYAVNIRKEPNASSDLVGTVTVNAQVTVAGEENGWYKVETEGKSGYIRKDLLSNTRTEVTSRSSVDRTSAKKTEASNTASSTKQEQQSTQNQASTNNSATTSTQNATQNANNAAQSANNASATNNSANTTTTKSSSGVTGADIAAYAKQFVGCRYVYGAAGPSSFDCSGLVMYVYKHFGYSLSHSSKVQATQGKAVTGDLQPGDILVFSNDGKTVGHVGIYIGNDQFVHASDSNTGVIIGKLSDKWNKSKYWGARRIL